MSTIKKKINSVNEDVEPLEVSYTAYGNIELCTCFEKSKAIFKEVKYKPTIGLSHSIVGIYP